MSRQKSAAVAPRACSKRSTRAGSTKQGITRAVRSCQSGRIRLRKSGEYFFWIRFA
jgi:hypothetical protein